MDALLVFGKRVERKLAVFYSMDDGPMDVALSSQVILICHIGPLLLL